MLKRHKALVLSAAILIITSFGQGVGYGQDSQSLGDAARQARLKKQQQEAASGNGQQAKDSGENSAQPAKPRVITNDEIPSHVGPTSTANSQQPVVYEQPSYGPGRSAADGWKAQIQAMKNRIASLEAEMARVNESVHFASGNCVANCVQHNERQLQKQQQVEMMKAQLEEQQKQLEQMQETARRQGFGSSVYDP